MTQRLNPDGLATPVACARSASGMVRRRLTALASVPVFVTLLSLISLLAMRAGVQPIWPANGVFLAGLLGCRARYRTLVFGSGVLALWGGGMLAGLPAAACVSNAIANGAEVAVATMLVGAFGSPPDFRDLKGIFRFTALAGALPAALFTCVAAGLHVWPAGRLGFAGLGSTWLGHAAGTVYVFPLCVTGRRPIHKLAVLSRSGLAAFALLVSTCLCVFGQSAYPLLFAVAAPLLGVVIAGGLEAGMAALLLVAVIATLALLAGVGPFALTAGGAPARMLVMQVFLAVCAAQVFAVATALSQRRRAEAALHAAQDQLLSLARIDGLTGIANRRTFDEALDREFRRAARHGVTLALLLLDVDRFKSYNDRYGHQAGDACLRKIAREVGLAARRPGDVAARYGGEELALLLPDTNAAGAEAVAQRLREAIEALGIPHAANLAAGGVVTASLGVAVWPAEPDIATKEDLVRVADTLLYEAKRLGRNKVVSQRTRPASPVPPALLLETERVATVDAFTTGGDRMRSKFLDLLAERAARLTGSPIGLVSLVGRDEQVFVGRFGLDQERLPRETSFCGHVITGTQTMVVPDAAKDPRFMTNDLVTGAFQIRFYAGSPINSAHASHPLGSLCAIDTKPHAALSEEQRRRLDDLADIAASYIDYELCAGRA